MFGATGRNGTSACYAITATAPHCFLDAPMPEFPEELRLSFEPAPSPDIRRALGDAIDAFNARTVPQDMRRFALLLHDGECLAAGLIGVLSWQWLFVAALWVDDTWRG